MLKLDMDKEDFEPGAAQHGNFINYYEFNRPHERLQLIPNSLIKDLYPNYSSQDPVLLLDIGCNSGDLTEAIHKHINSDMKVATQTFAFDLDPVLILRAKEKSTNVNNITYQCLNVMDESECFHFSQYLGPYSKSRFDVGFCFAVTMWIHLNHGDEGLRLFLHRVANLVNCLIIEPQPWRCYSSAARRLRRLKREQFTKLASIQIRANVVEYIDTVLTSELNMIRQEFAGKTKWGRSIVLFKHKSLL